MELSVRCYYVSVSYDKFIKRIFTDYQARKNKSPRYKYLVKILLWQVTFIQTFSVPEERDNKVQK